jgi:multiple sugar transport system permease protein
MNTSSETTARRLRTTGQYVFLVFLAFVFMSPLLWLILSSLKTQQEMVTFPPSFFPKVLQVGNYLLALTKIDYFRFLLNTIELCLLYTVPGIVSASIFGYAFARFQVPGRDFLFGIILVLLMIPPISVLLPEYIFFAKLKLVGSYKIWLLWGIGANPLYIYLLRQFFSYFPRELEEAAIIDGCSRMGILFRIFLPLSKPALVTVFILSFLWVYGDFIGPVIFLSGDNTTLPVAMANGYVIRNGILLVSVLLSGIVLYIVPVLLIFLFGQKYYIRGLLSSSGLKG